MNIQLSVLDISLSIIYIFIILFVSRLFRPKETSPYYNIYFNYIYYKIAFAIIFSITYIYYFKGGDTFLYFDSSVYLLEQLLNKPSNFFNLIFGDFDSLKNLNYTGKEHLLLYFKSNDILLTSKLILPFTLLCYKQYLATTILFTSATSVGLWKLYITLCKLYPNLYKYFAAGVLFYPTIAIWGSGILKDTITLMCVGLIFYSFYKISIREKILRSIVIISISVYICLYLKPYILYLFLPCMLLWLQNRISGSFKSTFTRLAIGLFLTITFSIAGFFLIQNISDGAGKYALENVESMAKGFQSWHKYLAETRNQSGYSLGEFEFTISGVLQKTPAALFVTFFRPFLFTDVTNFSLAFEGIQAFILLILTIYVLLKVGIVTFIKTIFLNKDVSAFVLFAILFGITVGMTSYNFGALSRYKIPCLPFFTASLAIIYYLGYLKPNNK